MYTKEQALDESLKYFGDELPAKTWIDKYALRNDQDELLESNPDQMHRRLAREFARIEQSKFKQPLSEEDIYQYFRQFEQIIPQGSPMFGIGNPYQYVSLSNCFVIDLFDSYGSILHSDQELVQISKRRGGVGLDLSNIRPKNTPTKNSSRSSAGIIPFMERFSNSIREVGQNGRRGALMLTLSVHHPEIEDFATIKRDLTKVTGANVSVKLSKEFMDAVKEDREYEQRWPLENPQFSQLVSARKVWNTIVQNAHYMAEPGLLNWHHIISESPADCYKEEGFETLSTNPCSEIPLCPYDSCRLMVINLFSCMENPFTLEAKFDYDKLFHLSKTTQRLMDDMIDLEIEHIDKIISKIKKDPEAKEIKRIELDLWNKIKEKCLNGRRTGTGPTALGDVLAALGLKYDSPEALTVVDKIYQTLKLGAYTSSVEMAEELGPFPIWQKEKEQNNPFLLRIKEEDSALYRRMQKYGRRNIALLTTAPTGTVSLLAKIGPYFGTTSGIEPCFMSQYTRRRKLNHESNDRVDFIDQNGDKWTEYEVYHSGLKLAKDLGLDNPYVGSHAEELNWINRVAIQAAAQKHVDHSLSSTINLPEDVTIEEVKTIYEKAWDLGLKGVTIYRKNCRTGVLVESKFNKTQAPKRPKELPCEVHHITVGGLKYTVCVGFYKNEPYEILVYKGFSKGTAGKIIKVKRGIYKAKLDESTIESITEDCSDEEDAITRLCSTALRHGADISFLVHQLEKTKGELNSFTKCLARTLKKYIKDGTRVCGEECPKCKSELIRQDGCISCTCGWSKCG